MVAPPDDEAWRRTVAAWGHGAVVTVQHAPFDQIDLDELAWPAPTHAVAAGLAALQVLTGEVERSERPLQAALVVPLPWSPAVQPRCPALSDLAGEPWEYGPGMAVPGLYLRWRGHGQLYEPGEEYRRTLPVDTALAGGCSAYYRCWRPDDIEQVQEHTRALYVHTA